MPWKRIIPDLDENDAECKACGWRGPWSHTDTTTDYKHGDIACPKCGESVELFGYETSAGQKPDVTVAKQALLEWAKTAGDEAVQHLCYDLLKAAKVVDSSDGPLCQG